MAPNTAMFSSTLPISEPAVSPPSENHMMIMIAEADNGACDHGHMRRLVDVLCVTERPCREIARPRQRVDLPALGEQDGVEAARSAR